MSITFIGVTDRRRERARHPWFTVQSARRQRLRLIGSVALTLVSGLLALIASTALGSSIANSGYDDQQNRAPALRIALAAAAFVVALAALRVAVKRLRGGQSSNIAAAILVALTLVLIFLLIIVAITSGPL